MALESRGVQTARYLPCIHLQSYMRERYGFREGLCPVAEGISRRTLALPFHARLEAGDQERRRGGAPRGAARVRREPGQGEALLVWGLWALVALAVLVTYSRLDPSLLYHTTGEGLGGGLSRVVVLLSFPISLVAVALTLLSLAALSRAPGGSAVPRSRSVRSPPSPVSSARRISTHAGSTRYRPPVSLSRSASPSPRRCGQASRSRRRCRPTASGSRWASRSAFSPCRGSRQSSASTCRATSFSAKRSRPARRWPPSISGTTTGSTAPCSSSSALLLSRRRPTGRLRRVLHRIRVARASATAP